MFQGESSQGWWKFNGTEDVKVDSTGTEIKFQRK